MEQGQQVVRQTLRRLSACRGEAVGGSLHLGESPVHLFHECLDALVEGGNGLQAAVEVVAQSDEGFHALHAMFLLQAVEQCQPFVDLLLPLGVVGDIAREGVERTIDVVELYK